MVKIPEILELLKAGVHFGHQTSRWHPKMDPYIFGVRNNVHIIDLEKTQQQLEKVQEFIDKIVANGGKILFLGTKNQVKKAIKKDAERCGMPYLNEKWIGGFFTNFSIVIKLSKKYKRLVNQRDSGELAKYTKKEQLDFEKEIEKLESQVYGVKDLEKLPDAIFVWDVKTEKTAIKESQNKNIPIIGICDTNTNPQGINYVIPTNDDGAKAVDLLMKFIADCVLDARSKVPQDKTPDVVNFGIKKEEGGNK